MNNRSGNEVLLVILLLAGVMLVALKVKKQGLTIQRPGIITQQTILSAAEIHGMQYSPTMAKLRKDLQALQDSGYFKLIIKVGKLPTPVLSQSTFSIINDVIECTVLVDTESIAKAGDRSEPILGHELKHIWDVLFLFDKSNPVKSVIKYLGTEKSLKLDRELEEMAVCAEDSIRRELKNSGNDLFLKMPKSRSEADILYNNMLNKPSISLKSLL